jgi:hypothetical protein
MTRYICFPDGAGEYNHDYTPVVVEAETPFAAAEIVTAPENGYGADDDGTVFVFEYSDAQVFAVNPSRRKIVTMIDTAEILLPVGERPRGISIL